LFINVFNGLFYSVSVIAFCDRAQLRDGIVNGLTFSGA